MAPAATGGYQNAPALNMPPPLTYKPLALCHSLSHAPIQPRGHSGHGTQKMAVHAAMPLLFTKLKHTCNEKHAIAEVILPVLRGAMRICLLDPAVLYIDNCFGNPGMWRPDQPLVS